MLTHNKKGIIVIGFFSTSIFLYFWRLLPVRPDPPKSCEEEPFVLADVRCPSCHLTNGVGALKAK